MKCRGCGRAHASAECPVDELGRPNAPAPLPGVVDALQLAGWGGHTFTSNSSSSSTMLLTWTVPPVRPPDDPPPAGVLARL